MNKKEEILKELKKIERLTKVFINDVENNETTNNEILLENLWKVETNLYNTLVKNLAL